jgi:hypothetical protein
MFNAISAFATCTVHVIQMFEQLRECWNKWFIDRGRLITGVVMELEHKIGEKGWFSETKTNNCVT